MSPFEFEELLGDLPDGMLRAANDNTYRKPRRLPYLVSALAACITAVIAAAVYPRLQTEKIPTLPESSAQETTVTAASAEETTASTAACTAYSEPTQTAVRTEPTDTSSSSQTTASAAWQSTGSVSALTTATASVTETASSGSHVPHTETETTSAAPPVTSSATAFYTTTSGEDSTTTMPETTEGVAGVGWGTLLPCRLLAQRILDIAPEQMDTAVQTRLYRDALPEEYAADLFPPVDFPAEDCMVIRFQAVGYGEGWAEELFGYSMLYSLQLIPPAAPDGTVQEIVLAVVVPKAYYSDRAPDGVYVWRRWKSFDYAGTEPHCWFYPAE